MESARRKHYTENVACIDDPSMRRQEKALLNPPEPTTILWHSLPEQEEINTQSMEDTARITCSGCKT